MSEVNIPFIKPHFPPSSDVAADYNSIVESNWFTNFGPYEQRLSRAVASFIGGGVHVATVANATLGIDIAVRALFKKNNTKNKVLVPSFTFASGPSVLIEQGYTPVFIDIDPVSLQPDLVQAKDYIASHQKEVSGILLCNTFGVGNLEAKDWEELSSVYDIPLMIDTAAGFGSRYEGREYTGARGDCEIFSLHATKPFSVGEGGLVISRNETLIRKIRSLENFGFDQNRSITALGTNAKLQELNCAIGLRQLETLENRLANRQESLREYKSNLESHGYLFQANDENSTVAFVSTIAPTADHAEKSLRALRAGNVEAKQYYLPLHTQKMIMQQSETAYSLKSTEDVARRILSLPLHDYMSKNTIKYITDIIKNS